MSSILSALAPALSPSSPADESRETRRASALAPKAEERDWSQPSKANSDQSVSFSDFLSVINPLQHIPVIGSIYRALTGDTISPTSRVIGGLLFGGPVGLIASALNAVVEQTKGKDLGEQALALFAPDKTTPAPLDPPTQFADAAPTVAENVASESPLTPLSRTEFAGTPAPGPAAALGADRTLAGSLYAPTAAAAPALQGRTLGDYRSFSGRPLPIIDTTRAPNSHPAPVRLQPAVTLPERARAVVGPPAKEAKPTTSGPTEGAPGPEAASPTLPTANDGFVAAMPRGLDRYREQRRLGSSPLQIDTTL